MARPMRLVQKDLLHKIWLMHGEGVPVSFLIRKEAMDITPPTLTKLISYMNLADLTKDKSLSKVIYDSLFPEWLNDEDEDVITSPSSYKYEGLMPYGKWVANGGINGHKQY